MDREFTVHPDMRDIGRDSDTQYSGMRRLAAAVLIQAIQDYNEAEARITENRPFFWQKKTEPIGEELLRLQREAFSFLTNNSHWHEILDLDPKLVESRLMNGTLVIE